MKVFYISPSVLPSRAANSVHVVMQSEALIDLGIDVTLFAKRSVDNANDLVSAIQTQYGVDLTKSRLITFYSHFAKADNLRIALKALVHLFLKEWPDFILSRNLYASYVIAILMRRPIIYETHQLENGFRKCLQRSLMLSTRVGTIVISNKLIDFLTDHHGIAPRKAYVLHDAAPDGLNYLPFESRRSQLLSLFPQTKGFWNGVCGYFGHLYPGRGIEIIEAMAAQRPDVLFLAFGGNDSDIAAKQQDNNLSNLLFMGHVSHELALKAMRSVDILLMPYQEHVSIGIAGHDTARWMSPMKMFEYMSSAVPIISSDLPVLREILTDGDNALLVPSSNSSAWVQAMDKLLTDNVLRLFVGSNAYRDYQNKHTWKKRAKSIIAIAKNL